MNRPEASDGFAADIRCELLIMIPVGARRIGVVCRMFWSYVKGCSGRLADEWLPLIQEERLEVVIDK
jgi:hypothetical protein